MIGKILTEIEMLKNCQFSRLTGSGSTCFGLFLSKKDGVSALRRIKKKFPNFWFWNQDRPQGIFWVRIGGTDPENHEESEIGESPQI